jgi:hypothetical protein
MSPDRLTQIVVFAGIGFSESYQLNSIMFHKPYMIDGYDNVFVGLHNQSYLSSRNVNWTMCEETMREPHSVTPIAFFILTPAVPRFWETARLRINGRTALVPWRGI